MTGQDRQAEQQREVDALRARCARLERMSHDVAAWVEFAAADYSRGSSASTAAGRADAMLEEYRKRCEPGGLLDPGSA